LRAQGLRRSHDRQRKHRQSRPDSPNQGCSHSRLCALACLAGRASPGTAAFPPPHGLLARPEGAFPPGAAVVCGTLSAYLLGLAAHAPSVSPCPRWVSRCVSLISSVCDPPFPRWHTTMRPSRVATTAVTAA